MALETATDPSADASFRQELPRTFTDDPINPNDSESPALVDIDFSAPSSLTSSPSPPKTPPPSVYQPQPSMLLLAPA